MKKLLCLFLALWSGAAAAQPRIPELEPIKALEGTPALRDYWRQEIKPLYFSYRRFLDAAFAAQCDRIPQDRPLLLIPEYRQAIQAGSGLLDRMPEFRTPDAQRWLNRAALFAYSRLSAAERASLRKYFDDAELIKYLSAVSVLEDFASIAHHPVTGEAEPTAVIALKQYFRREGELEALRKRIAALGPELLEAFDKVGELAAHGEADAAWLGRLTLALLTQHEKLITLYMRTIPTQAAIKLNAFQAHPFNVWLNKAAAASSQGAGKPAMEAEQIYAELESKYPQPTELYERMQRMGPYDYAGGEIERFCPPDGVPTPAAP